MAHHSLPRAAYWAAGGALAIFGAMIARGIGEQVPVNWRYLVWIAGTAVIFLGLRVLSLGSHTRNAAGKPEDRPERDDISLMP